MFSYRIRLLPLLIISLLSIFKLAPAAASNLEDFAQKLSLVPSLFETYITDPDTSLLMVKQATCFPLKVILDQDKDEWLPFFVANYHTLTLRDSLGKVIAEVDTGKVFRNAEDTVITLRVKLFRKNPALDLALLEMVDTIPSTFKIETTGIKIYLNQGIDPKVGENIFYGGFPLLLGLDRSLKRNFPLIINGSVSQANPDEVNFIVQAPIFSGASGSPILSQNDGRFLGVIYASVPNQESLLYALKATTIRDWIKNILYDSIQSGDQRH